METKIVCPFCGSEDLHALKSGKYICENCERLFTPEDTGGDTPAGGTGRPMKIFISYAHAQNEIVQSIMEALKARGHEVWFDKNDIHHGDDWRKAITDGLTSCNGVVSFLSREAIREGGVCLDELGIAVGVKYGNIQTVLLHKEKDLQPIPAQLTRRQWLDMSDWQEIRERSAGEYRAWLEEKIGEIIRMVESDEVREFAGQISRIREKLSIDDRSISRQAWYLSRPFVGREWLTEKIENWLNDPAGGHMCAVYGGPGTGKSAFAAQFVYHSPRVGASLFFEHGNEHFNSPEAIVRELVFQLSCRLPEYRSLLIYELDQISNLQALNPQEQFQRLLAVPLQRSIGGHHETLCVVVDGLDECTEEGKRQAARLLSSEYFPSWLRILVLTRPENAVTGSLRPDITIDMTGNRDANTEDIRRYYEKRLGERLRQSPDRARVLDELTKRTNGVFLYAYIVSGMILQEKLDPEDPAAYPRDLNGSFAQWFSRYFPDRDEYDRFYRLPLGIIAASEQPVPVEELETADGEFVRGTQSYVLREKDPERHAAGMAQRLERCAPLLRYGTDEFGKTAVGFTHRYIGEWLTGKDGSAGQSFAAEFFCDPRDAMWALEKAWRNRLESTQPLTEYQALHLQDAMIRAGESEEVIRAAAASEPWGKVLKTKRKEYDRAGKWDLCLLFARAECARCRAAFGEEHPDTLAALSALASVLSDLGKYRETLEIREKVYETRKRIFGAEHPDTLPALSNLALTLSDMGRYREALAKQQQAYEAEKRILGEENPETLAALNNLASCLSSLGMSREAGEKQKLIYEIKKRTLGDEHPDTLFALSNLAFEMAEQGNYQEALEWQELVYEKRKQTLGEDHPDTLLALNNLAYTLNRLGRDQEALEKKERVYEGRKRILGEEHPDTLIALHNLASSLRVQGRYQEALEKQKQVYEMSRRVLGDEHRNTLSALGNMAVTLSDMGRDQEALEKNEQVYEMSRRVLGEDHPDTLLALGNLAVSLSEMDRDQEALEKKEQVYEAKKRILGENHPGTLTALSNLAISLGKLGRHEEALEKESQLYEARKRVLGEDHPDTIRALSNLSDTLEDLGRKQEALEIKEQVYEARKRVFGEEHPVTMRTMRNIGVSLYYMDRRRESLEMLERAYDAQKRVLGENHPDTQKTLKDVTTLRKIMSRG